MTGYEVCWITSTPRYRQYTSTVIRPKIPMNEVNPGGNGIKALGRWLYATGRDRVKYAVLCAPSDLNSRTIPAFVESLKNAGVTVDFDYRFTLGGQRELEFKREQAEIAVRLEKIQEMEV